MRLMKRVINKINLLHNLKNNVLNIQKLFNYVIKFKGNAKERF